MRNKWFPIILAIMCSGLAAFNFATGQNVYGFVMLGFVGVNYWSYTLRCEIKKNDDEKYK